ncbi:MAG TPA: YeeE/YedE thiosulfate transporter family protein [Thermoanaerobaculaceae bacterium]|nr:YeeE/YedE thiosulfate transporter family protein [Thermoanaerobaculaceae bacterium]HRS15097.1 YeeE/YedE thiosulfate transporter family protein [Thermoanaerobaculaceae bacterium]
MFPLSIESLGSAAVNGLYVLTGFLFGFALEQAGFGNSRNLASQFYLTDMRVLKVMFSAIVTAMLLLFGLEVAGLVRPGALYINPTHLWPGIVGGVIFGVGFVIGGYCPGTAVVSLSTLKLDGAFFVLGLTVGMVAFGETLPLFRGFFDASGALGEVTLNQALGLPRGVLVVLIVLMALGMFWVAERLEGRYGKRGSESC